MFDKLSFIGKWKGRIVEMEQTLVISRSSVSVKLEGRHLIVHDHADKSAAVEKVPLAEVGRVMVCGRPSISFSVLACLMDMKIPVGFVTTDGRWRGLMDGDIGFHADRRRKQYESMADAAFQLTFAKRCVHAKIRNCRRTIQRLAANRKFSPETLCGWNQMTMAMDLLPSACTVAAVRGIEGIAAVGYFDALSCFFPKETPWAGRSRRPPRDIPNALLSFLYTLLSHEVESQVRAHGLDCAAGCLHCGNNHAPALALDLMEPFRSVVVDRLVLDLLNHRRLSLSDDFECSQNGGVYLSEKGRPKVFRAFDEVMRRRSFVGGRSVTVRQLINADVCSYIAFLEKGTELKFYQAA